MKKVLKTVFGIIGILVLLVVAFFGVLTVTEYKPADSEGIDSYGTAMEELNVGDSVDVVTWNIGYGGLGAEEDFFMDGGSRVHPYSSDEVWNNIYAIEDYLYDCDADAIFLQEIDIDASRTYHINEVDTISGYLGNYMHSFANNFKVLFIPYPIPPMGKMDGGILTLTKFGVLEAERIQLPIPFKYPVRLGNLKRCLLIDRIPIEGSDKELVLVNLHLEAYDDGEGKVAQTKMLRDVLEKEYEKGNYVIAAGDFNQSFSNADISVFPVISEDNWAPGIIDVSDFPEHYSLVMDNRTPSCRSLDQPLIRDADPTEFQYYLIDGFICSDNLKIEDLETVDLGFENSDHNPVHIKVRLTE